MQTDKSKFNAMLNTKHDDGSVECLVCMRKCRIPKDGTGFCHTRINQDGSLYSIIYGLVSSAAVDPIEKKPVYHYLPGTKCFSLGTFGCNFRCKFCQNWEIAYADGSLLTNMHGRMLSPKQAVELAIQENCDSISWTYNEPAIWFEYVLDCAKIAVEHGVRTVFVTNGYISPEALDAIGPYMNVFRVDIKSLSNDFYRKLIKIQDMKPILQNTIKAKEKWKMHIETVTNIIPGWNDTDEDLYAITNWVAENLGELTPWHATRFFPHAEMQNIPPTPVSTLEKAKLIGTDNGLKHIFIGNINSFDNNTYCPSCSKKIINRNRYFADIIGIQSNGRCSYCNAYTGVVCS